MLREATIRPMMGWLGSIIGGATPGPGPRLETLCPGWKNIVFLTLYMSIYATMQSVPHLKTIVPRLCPGLSQKLAPILG